MIAGNSVFEYPVKVPSVIFVKLTHPENAELLILVTELGIVILVNLVLLKNALAKMLVIVEARIIFWLVAGNSVFEYPVKVPSVIFVKLLQPENAELSMLATELGIVILVNLVLF